MNFTEALKALKDGEHLCRAAWKYEEGYLIYLEGMSHIWKVTLPPTPNAGNYIFSMEDLGAEDWKKFELPIPHEPCPA